MNIIIVSTKQREKIHPHKFILWVAIASILMMFAGLTSAFIVKSNLVAWKSIVMPKIFWVSTIAILVSSLTVQMALRSFQQREMRQYRMLIALTFLLGTAAALFLRFRNKHAASNVTLALMMAAFFFFAHLSLATFEPYLSSRALAEAIDREYRQGDTIVINGEYEGGSSINFYTRKMVYILNGRSANLEYGSYFQDAPRIFLDNEALAKLWGGSGRVFLFTDSSTLDEVNRAAGGPAYPIAESGGKLVVTNQQSK